MSFRNTIDPTVGKQRQNAGKSYQESVPTVTTDSSISPVKMFRKNAGKVYTPETPQQTIEVVKPQLMRVGGKQRGSGSGGAITFKPSDISNIFCWYESDYLVKDINNNIYGLADLSGLKNDAYMVNTSYNPLAVTNQINGKSIARFSGTRKELVTPPFGVSCESTEWSMVIVAKIPVTAAGNYRGVITNRPYGVTDRWFTFGSYYDPPYTTNVVGIEARHSINGATNTDSGYTSNNTFSIYSLIKTLTNFSLFRNGSSILSTNVNIGGGTDTTRPWRIGTWFFDNQSLEGDIPFLSIYKKALTSTEQSQLESYVNGLYAIS